MTDANTTNKPGTTTSLFNPDPAPSLDPKAYSDLIQRVTETEPDSGGQAAIVDLRVVRAGWEASATIKAHVFKGELGAGVQVRQHWGGPVDAAGLVRWERKW